jgi:hypothetical protein
MDIDVDVVIEASQTIRLTALIREWMGFSIAIP